MNVTITIRAEGMINVEVPDDKLAELEAFLEDHQAHGPLDPDDLPAYCGVDVVDLPNQVRWEVDDVWWKDQGK